MTLLIIGLALFVLTHSLRFFAADWRNAQRARLGEPTWRVLHSIVSLVSFGLIVWGFAQARLAPTVLWLPPTGMRHATALFTLVAFVLMFASVVPRNGIKARVHHPLGIAVIVWAIGHLLANGTLVHLVLFGTLLLWGLVYVTAARRHERAQNVVYAPGEAQRTAVTFVLGLAGWALFAFWLHGVLIGVRPFG